ncbi:MAG: glycosyltransferase family 4 protein [Planctomycetota bacterium]
MFDQFPFLLPLAVSIFAGLALVPLCIRLANRLGIIDNPAHRKIHARATPYLGGIAVLGGMACAIAVSWKYWPEISGAEISKIALISGATVAAMLLGLVDDRFHIRPRYKFLGQFLIATLFALFAYRFELFQLPGVLVDLQVLGVPLTIFWFIAIVNGFNMVDGMDGLAGTVSLAGMANLVVFSVLYHDPSIGLLGLAGFGALSAFLVFNWSPAKIFLGDAGSLALGTFFATSLLAIGNVAPFGLPHFGHPTETLAIPFKIATVTMVVIYPALEVLLSVSRRLLRGKPISSADKGHIHHRMLALGWRPSWICIAVTVFTLLAQTTVMAIIAHNYSITAWLLSMFAISLGLGLHYLGILELLNPLATRYFRPHYQIANHLIAMQRLKLTLTQSADQVISLTNATCRELGVLRYSLNYIAHQRHSSIQQDWYNPDEAQIKHADAHGILVAGPREGFTDHARLPEIGAEAVWTFKAIEREQELDVEYRVLMSTFMEAVLERLQSLPQTTPEDARRKSTVIDPSVSAATLRDQMPRPGSFKASGGLAAGDPRPVPPAAFPAKRPTTELRSDS